MATEQRRRRIRWAAWLLLVVATVGGFVTGAQPWWQAVTTNRVVPITGTESAAGLPQALAAVVAAGLLLSLTLRGWGRPLLGVLLALTGLGAVVLGVLAPQPSSEVINGLVQQVTLDPVDSLRRDWGGYGFVGSGGAALLGGIGLVLAGRSAARPDRFRRAGVGEQALVAPDADPVEVWRALDRGADPTAAAETASGTRPD